MSRRPHLLTKCCAGIFLFLGSFWVTLMDMTIVENWERASREQWASYSSTGNVLVEEGRLDDALKAYRNSLAIAARFAAANHGDREWQNNLSLSYTKVADVLNSQGKLEEALSYLNVGKTLMAQQTQTAVSPAAQ
jgi:tetratricopeptide (TPR) repeat protein